MLEPWGHDQSALQHGDTNQGYLPHSSLPSTQHKCHSWSTNKRASSPARAFLVTFSLHYYSSLLYGLQNSKIAPLQRVQHIAARIASRTKLRDHITPVLKEIHWLKVKARILFKVLLLTFKATNNLAPPYLCSHVEPDVKERELRLNQQYHLKLQNSRPIFHHDCSFRVAASREWNKLPVETKQSPSVDSFKLWLKTYLFHELYN